MTRILQYEGIFMKEIKIVVIDDSSIIHALLNRTVGATDDIRIIGNAQNGNDGIEMVKTHSPDVVIMDITMPGMSGLEAISHIMEEKPMAESISEFKEIINRKLVKSIRTFSDFKVIRRICC